ncbi:MAG: helix-turn-helix transcriptional regulator [Sterolibacterium sp.]
MKPEELKAWRSKAGMTQDQLAKALDVPTATIARWETGTMKIRHELILELALEGLFQRRKQGN